MKRVINPEFQVTRLTAEGVSKAEEIALVYDEALEKLKKLCPRSRQFSIAKARLEESCFFAKKAMSMDKRNQQETLG